MSIASYIAFSLVTCGNMIIYYKDAVYANGVVKLGKIESGVEKLGSINGNFIVKIEKID